MTCVNYYQRLTLFAGDYLVAQAGDQYVSYKVISDILNETLNEAIVEGKVIEIYRANMHYNVVESRNPSLLDDYYIPGMSWHNCETGEVFYLQKERLNDKPIWIGDHGTYIADTTTTVFDLFGDGSAVALYEFNRTLNDTGGRYNLTEHGSVTFVDGIYGSAASFSHRSYCEAPNLKNISTGDGTVSVWIKPKRFSAPYGCIWHFSRGGDNRFSLWIERSGRMYAIIRNRYNIYLPHAKFDNWYHIVVTSDARFYVNGQKVVDHSTNSAYKTDLSITNMPFLVAADRDGRRIVNDWYQGIIDELRIFNKNVSDSDVEILFREGKDYV